jgi:hypothetical protein
MSRTLTIRATHVHPGHTALKNLTTGETTLSANIDALAAITALYPNTDIEEIHSSLISRTFTVRTALKGLDAVVERNAQELFSRIERTEGDDDAVLMAKCRAYVRGLLAEKVKV